MYNWNRESGDHGTTERSFNAVSALCVIVERQVRFDAHANRLQDRRQPMAKSGKFVRAYSRTALDCERKTILCFLPSLSTPRPLFERGLGGGGERERFEMAASSKTRKPSCQSPKQRQLRPRSGSSKEGIPQQRTASTEPISRKGIKLTPKTIGNRKRDCA